MYITDARSRLQVDLSDITEAVFNNDVLDRSVQRAVSDLSRFLPLESVLEITLIFTITDEDWTSAAAAGTYVALANKPIKFDSETVANNAGTTMVRDTDYTMDYINGKITHISGGSIGNDEACTISYTKSEVTVDISSVESSLIRVDRVEYPVGEVPRKFVSKEVWKDLLTVVSEGPYESQTSMTEKDHLLIYYKAKHTVPTETAEGSYPTFLDDTVILAGSAYALFTLGVKYVAQSVTDLASMRTALGNIAAKHTIAAAALAKVTDYVNEAHTVAGKVGAYLESNATTDNAVDVLANVTDDIAELRTKITTAVGAIATALGLVNTYSLDKATVGAEAYLDTGDGIINTVPLGKDVPANYANFTRARVEIAQARIAQATAYAQEATLRLGNIQSYISESAGWVAISDGFVKDVIQRISMAQTHIAEATAAIAQMDRYLAEADQYRGAANADLLLADKFKDEAIERRNEAWAIWRDAPHFIPNLSSASARQPND